MRRKHRLSLPFIFVAFLLWGCNVPRTLLTQPTETPIPVVPPTLDETPLPTSRTGELGLAENPLILALPPSANSSEQINAAREITAQFMARTGYVVVVVAPNSYAELVDALEKGNAHIVLLDPLSYALAYQEDLVRAQYAVVKNGKIKYGSQFLAPRKGGYTSYFDAESDTNITEASVALSQFNDKKPCWSEETSPSGYVIPLGLLNQAQVEVRPAAFVGSQPTVVRSVYVGGICDFGATYIDARKFPSLEDEMPDLVEQVLVIWRTPEIIPYEVLAFSTNMPQPMQNLFFDLIPAIFQTDEGNAAFKTAFNIEGIQGVNDSDFSDFHNLVDESGVDLLPLLKR